MLELLVRFVLVGGIVVGGLLALRRANARGMTARGGPSLRVVGRTGLTRSALVAVVAVDDRRFLVGASDQGVQLLRELDAVAADGDDLDEELALLTGTGGVPEGQDAPTDHELTSATQGTGRTTHGPRIGPLDRLREMTVRTPHREPIRAPRPDRR